MTAITKCLNGDKCPKSEHCHRWTKQPTIRQDYQDIYIEGYDCKDFMWNFKYDYDCKKDY